MHRVFRDLDCTIPTFQAAALDLYKEICNSGHEFPNEDTVDEEVWNYLKSAESTGIKKYDRLALN
eukprot:7903237-Lingulodinium_polyedra.AAC.1